MNNLPVTDHALIRYIERVVDIDLTDVKLECAKRFRMKPSDAHLVAFIAYKTGASIAAMKKAILDAVSSALGGALSEGRYDIGGFTYVVADNCVVTVYRSKGSSEGAQ